MNMAIKKEVFISIIINMEMVLAACIQQAAIAEIVLACFQFVAIVIPLAYIKGVHYIYFALVNHHYYLAAIIELLIIIINFLHLLV